jgi:hypothetical protein
MPALTIDKFDLGINIQYARRTELIEQVRQQYQMPEAAGVPAQALIVDLYPKLTELDLLLGVATLHAPWAYFYPPKKFRTQRRSPFAFHRVIPIFGSDEEQEAKMGVLDEEESRSPEEAQEKEKIKACFQEIGKINDLLRYIGGRVGQFLQG